jgi:SAM-dependent methyltransferase
VDKWKFFAITHRDHVIMNPISTEALDEVLKIASIPANARVLDIGCGKGELLIRLARLGAKTGIGVELSPYTVREARERVRSVAPKADITILEEDGATFAAQAESFDLAACVGASWIFGGHRGTLRALARWARSGGLVLVAEPFWRVPPDPEYLASQELRADEFGSHASNVTDGETEGLIPLFARAAEATEWDRYEGLRWHAGEEWARENPSDPDRVQLLRKVRESRNAFLRWGRDAVGDGLYLFRKP